MENQTIYAKLRRMESFLEQIPEDFRTLFMFNIIHTKDDFVGMSFHMGLGNYVGLGADKLESIRVHEYNSFRCLSIQTPGADITLYQNGHSHTTLL